MGLIGTLIFALCLGFGIELVINAVQWHKQGFKAFSDIHLERLQREQQAIALRSPRVGRWLKTVTDRPQGSHFYDKVDHDMAHIAHLSALDHLNILEAQSKTPHNPLPCLTHLAWFVWFTVEGIAMKAISVACALFVFIFAAIVGLLDGFLARMIRTAESGRESTFLFHRVSSSLFQLPLWVLVLYFVLPIAFQPIFAIVLLALIFFSVCYLSSSQLKKYL